MSSINAAKLSLHADSLTAPLEPVVVRVRDDGKIVTDSVVIAKEFGRRHDNVLASLRSLIADCTISPLEFKERDYQDDRGKMQPCIELTERAALIAMPFMGGRKSREGQRRLVLAFDALRDELARVKTAVKPASSAVALPDFTDPAASAEAWALQYRGRVAAESERNQLRIERSKDSEFVAKYCDADGLMGVREACQCLDIENEHDFTDFLENALRCMYRLSGKLVGRAQHRHAKRFKTRTGINHGTNRAYSNSMITAKGVTWLAREWAEYNLDREAYIAKHAPKAGDVDEEVEEATREAAERCAARGRK